ncbi:E3 ubiquitin-protein ligase RNF6 isoform X2 [Erythrolamprus reginae]|uniref:E3 ubiquitin-protein ligase RNF6 isoform X2 n=1 Tax=Erythrolamprus reginae TaxID=121349 RepID=UPI00396CA02B
MACSRSCSGENGEQTTSQSNSGDNERQWQQERLIREEAYYEFINALSDEDYRLMRDCNLLGTPGEITADELQQRLQNAKENQSSQSEPENREWEGIGNSSGLLTQNAEENSRFFSGRLGARSSASSTASSLLDDNEHNIIRQRRTQRMTPVRYHPGRARTRRNSRQRTEVLRLRSTFRGQFQSLLENWQPVNIQQIPAGVNRAHTTQPPPEETEEQASSLGVSLEEEGPARTAAASRSHPSISLNLQVRRIRPRENGDRDSIASRTRARAGTADNSATLENDTDRFVHNILRGEHAGIRTFINTVRIPLHGESETQVGELSSETIRSILRQIMIGFGELSSLMDTETGSETEGNTQPLSEAQPPAPNLDTLNNIDVFNATLPRDRLTEQGIGERQGEANSTQHPQHNNPPNSRASFVENGTLPMLRLIPYLLLQEDFRENLRGLTKDQIDNLSTRIYENPHSDDDEISKTCSVCINDYAVGNKLRQLPCMHEFHFHCIDRWLSENSTCPICRQPVVT